MKKITLDIPADEAVSLMNNLTLLIYFLDGFCKETPALDFRKGLLEVQREYLYKGLKEQLSYEELKEAADHILDDE